MRTKEECMQYFIDNKGDCLNFGCRNCCFFINTNTNSAPNKKCYIVRYRDYLYKKGIISMFIPTLEEYDQIKYHFAKHYFNRKIKLLQRILK